MDQDSYVPPPKEDKEPPEALPESDRPPFAVWTLLALIVIAFMIQGDICYSRSGTGHDLSVTSLIAAGGLSVELVHNGEWFRLLTANFLHGSFSHLFFNAVALYLANRLEIMIGAAWFGAMFILSGLGGSLLVLVSGSDAAVTIGASGAILGVFAAQCVLAYACYPDESPLRRGLANRAWSVLLPTLLSFGTGRDGSSLSIAAHFGGAITGALLGLVFAIFWRPEEMEKPHAEWAAWTINGLAAAVVLYAIFGPLMREGCVWF